MPSAAVSCAMRASGPSAGTVSVDVVQQWIKLQYYRLYVSPFRLNLVGIR